MWCARCGCHEFMRTLGWNEVFEYEYSVQGWASCWLFRSALEGETLFSSLDAVGDWLKKGSYYTAWSVPWDSSCTCLYAYGHGPAIGSHTGKRCWPLLAGVWSAIALLMKPWCAEGDVPTAANLNLLPGMEFVCGLALRRGIAVWRAL